MDVRCERCKTEYEFDDARITEAGVTVKCTTCGHVFKVKKKALVVTVPVKPEDADQIPAAQAIAQPDPKAEKPREWKVRQASGNVFSFKELTTLQKWIVERKVTREDEISLTGETWKRLGNIAELASFFQVVDDAQKAAQLSALQNLGALGPQMTPPGGYPIPPGIAQPPPAAVALLQNPSYIPALGQVPSPTTPVMPLAAVAPPLGAPANPMTPAATYTTPGPAPHAGPAQVTHFSAPTAQVTSAPSPAAEPPTPAAAAPVPTAEPPTPAIPSPVFETPSSLPPMTSAARSAARPQPKSRGGLGLLLTVLVLAALGGGGYWAYGQGMLPFVDELLAKVMPPKTDPAPVVPTPPVVTSPVEVAAADAGAKTEQEVAIAPEAIDAGVVAAEAHDAGSATAAVDTVPDAGTVVATAVVPIVEPKKKPEPVRDFDWYMNQGDKLRDRDRAEAALDSYGKAADLQPNRAEPVAGRGLALLDMGATVQAEAAFQQALKLNGRYGVAIMGLAEALRIQGKNDEAVKYYQKYLDVLPNGPEAPVARGAIQRLGK